MAPSERYLTLARELVLRHFAGHPVDVFLFGSWARGAARRTSDIDIAVLPKGPIPPVVFSELREALEEAPIPYPVDIVDLREVSAPLRARVLKEGIRWSV